MPISRVALLLGAVVVVAGVVVVSRRAAAAPGPQLPPNLTLITGKLSLAATAAMLKGGGSAVVVLYTAPRKDHLMGLVTEAALAHPEIKFIALDRDFVFTQIPEGVQIPATALSAWGLVGAVKDGELQFQREYHDLVTATAIAADLAAAVAVIQSQAVKPAGAMVPFGILSTMLLSAPG